MSCGLSCIVELAKNTQLPDAAVEFSLKVGE